MTDCYLIFSCSDYDCYFLSSFQGVGLCLGEVFQSSMSRRKLIGAAEAGMIWILDRCSAIIQTDLYLIKPDDKEVSSLYMYIHTVQQYYLFIERIFFTINTHF